MKIGNLFVCVVLAVLPAACGNKEEKVMDKMVGMMEELGNAVDGAKGDCGKMADSVGKVASKYEGDVKEMKATAQKMKGDKAKAEEMQKKYGPRMEKAMPKLMGLMACATDPKMKDLQAKFDGML
jgi:hypothetical protein